MKTKHIVYLWCGIILPLFLGANMSSRLGADMVEAEVKLYDGSVRIMEIEIPTNTFDNYYYKERRIQQFRLADRSFLSWKYVEYVKFSYQGEHFHYIPVSKEKIAKPRTLLNFGDEFFLLEQDGPCRVFYYYHPYVTVEGYEEYYKSYFLQKGDLPALNQHWPLWRLRKELSKLFYDCPQIANGVKAKDADPADFIGIAAQYEDYCQ